ncbi:MAG: PsbP-related protein [Thermoleophilia bacterium]
MGTADFTTVAAMVLLAVLAAGCSNTPQSTSPASMTPTATSALTPTSVSTPTSGSVPTSGSATTTHSDSSTINAAATTTVLASPALTASESPVSPVPSGPLVTYEEPDLGFSIAYPKGWRLTEAAGVAHVVGGDPIKNVGLFDPTGNHDGVVLLEGVTVSVFKLRVVVNAELLTAFRQVVENQVSLLQAGLSQVEIIEGLHDSEIGGTQAVETTFRFTAKGRRMRTRLVFLVSGGFEYQLTAQASDASYGVARPRLDQVIGSFRLKD